MTEALKDYRDKWKISIHTPARGVTYRELNMDKFGGISIHTPARGVTFLKLHFQ